jgi:hypothetical protein
MDHVILLYCGGSGNDQFELVGMKPHMLTFEKQSQFNELVAIVRVVMNVGCDLRLQRRYDMGEGAIDVMPPLGLEDECQLYKTCARDSGLKGANVVAKVAPLPSGEITVHITGMPTKEVSLGSEFVKANSEALNLALVRDEFDADMFDPNPGNE